MAITKSTTLEHVHIDCSQDPAHLEVIEGVSWDDPDDDELPIHKSTSRMIRKNTVSVTYDAETGEAISTETPTDLSNEDQVIQDIAAAIWAD